MANVFQQALQAARDVFSRSRIGKYDSQEVERYLGINTLTNSGSYVSERNAMGISAVYACVQRISSSLAGLRLEIYENQGRNIEIANLHPSYDLVRRNPNRDQTSFEFFENLISHALIQGVGRAIILRNNRGDAVEMYVVPKDDVDEREYKGEKVYYVQGHGNVFPMDMLEICNLNRMSPIALHRENLGLTQAAMEFGSKYFGNGGQMSGIMSSDAPLRAEQMKEVIQSWRSQGEAGTKILSHGFKYNRVSISPDEAQFIDTRKFQAEEIARIFGVPPALIWLDTQTTYSNTEQQAIQFTRHTLTPWATRLEQEMDRKLLNSGNRANMYFKYRMDDLLRGDMAARSAFYREMFSIGAISPNEIRHAEDMNPISGGDTYAIQLNQIDLNHFGSYSEKISQPVSPNFEEQNVTE
jgi:HK97 family phage portal protein